MVKYTGNRQPPYLNITIEHAGNGISIMTIKQNNTQAILFLSQSSDFTLDSQLTQRKEMYFQ